MKTKYTFHPRDYAIGETEKFYSDMAKKGWILKNRRPFWSKFKKTEPQRIRYRIELIPRKLFEIEGESIPNEEQLAIFKDCGWTYVTGENSVHVFSAPYGTNAPEFYLEPEQQAPIVKKIRNFNIYYLLLYTFIFFNNLFVRIMFGDSFAEVFAEYYYSIICSSTLELIIFILVLLVIVFFFIRYLNSIFKYNRLYKQLKKGIPIDHSPNKKSLHFPLSLLILVAAVLGLISILLSKVLPEQTYSISYTLDNPAINLQDTSIEIPEITRSHSHNIEYSKSVLSENWYSSESIYGLNYDDIRINQDIYRMKYDFMCESFAKALMIARTYTVDPEDFVEVEIQGLDKALSCENICIVIKDDLVYLIRYYNDLEDDTIPILQAIADKDYE